MKQAIEQLRAGDLAHVEHLRRQVLDFCATHPDALERTCPEAHLTATAHVVDPADGRFVLLHHRKIGRWVHPGGHADGDSDLAAVALREAEEETGLAGLRVVQPAVDLDVHVFEAPGEPRHLHLDLRFVVLAPPGSAAAPPPGNDESTAIRWVRRDDLDALGIATDDSVRRFAARAADRIS